MDIHSNSREHATPLSYKTISFYKTEDSGYHTSFATSSLEECSGTPSELQDSSLVLTNFCHIKVGCYLTPDPEGRLLSRDDDSFYSPNNNSSAESTPFARRGVKRRYDGGQNEIKRGAITTPTSLIAKEVQKLKFNDAKICKTSLSDSGPVSKYLTDTCYKDYYGTSVTHPSTPIKKNCSNNCNLSPFNRQKTPRKVDFEIHSLSCEKQILRDQPKSQHKNTICNRFGYKPNQKLDIIKMLYDHEKCWSASLKKILDFLTIEDNYNFTLVSPIWSDIFKNVNTKQKYKDIDASLKSNVENRYKVEAPKVIILEQAKPLKEIQNINLKHNIPHSPSRSPRTTRFNKFTKAASLDTRSQILCIKCSHPAKVTVESSGEEWGECTSSTCAEQFCKRCKYERHPGKTCLQYDLNGPSPSKRKMNVCPISSKKSKKNLKRLLRF